MTGESTARGRSDLDPVEPNPLRELTTLKRPDMSRDVRLTAYKTVSESLSSHSDHALQQLLDTALPLGSGIGGTSALLEVAGTQVFVKRVSLTDLERRPEHLQSTANLFGLPAFCHYGVGTIGSPGSGAWRELAVHTMTTNWVLTAEHEGFPLMYHWRVLPGSTPLSKELADVERAVAYWDDAPQVRRRIHALQQSSTSVALFLEYIPEDLHQWLGVQVEAGDGTTDQAATMVERELEVGTSFMQSRGLLHFDAHFENILTDGRRLYFADFGLALSSDFDLSPEEADFCDRHQSYDRSYTATYLVNWLVTALHGYARQDQEGRCTMVRAYAEGRRPAGIPDATAAILARNAPIAVVMSDFSRRFQHRSRRTPYPLRQIQQLSGARRSSL